LWTDSVIAFSSSALRLRTLARPVGRRERSATDAVADDLHRDTLLSGATIQRIRAQIARTALEQVSRSSVA
jgi:hypothetical protein